jgi:hypothetical protein
VVAKIILVIGTLANALSVASLLLLKNGKTMRYTVNNITDPFIPYIGALWEEVELLPESYEYIEDALEVAHIFNSATKSSSFIVTLQKEE